MKKLLGIVLCVCVLFSVISCKQTIKEENGGILTIRPASGCEWGTQTDRFQFQISQPVNKSQSIEFLAKFSSEVTAITVRNADTVSEKWLSSAGFDELKAMDDGWYKVEVDENDVLTNSSGLAMTLAVSAQTQDIFISIKNLRIDGKLIDFSSYNEENCVDAFYSTPNLVSAEITR